MTPSPYLGVEKSLTGRRWQTRGHDERTAQALVQRHALPEVLAASLSARGLTLEDAETFLAPKLRTLLPNPSILKDMDKATARFVEAIKNNEPLAIFGDYDVDGATSSALLIRFFRALGLVARLYIPDRQTEGYGPNVGAMKKLATEGIKLAFCVDCGTTAHEPLKEAQANGLDIIVLDHHTSEPALPPAIAVVNPNRLDETGDYEHLAAVGVVYLFVIAANRALREEKYYTPQRPEPNLMQWLDIVALGTICDVVKLVGLNRAFVAQGLKIAAQRQNIGLASLAQIANATNLDPYAVGFILGPRINAGGRIGESTLGAKLLSTEDASEAQALSHRMNALNAERRDIEAKVLAEAERLTMEENLPLAFVASENWHAGVIGIVASRLKEKFGHPALVVSLDGDIGKGSGRSVAPIDLGAAIIAARQAGLLINGGGHEMAAGFTVERAKLEDLKNFLAERIGRQIEAEPLIPTLTLDGLISGPAINLDFMDQIERLGPFGTGNPEPRFAIPDCKIIRADVVGEKHVSIIFTHASKRLKAIAFRALESDLGQAFLQCPSRIHLAGHLRINEWQGNKTVQLHVTDAALPL